MIKPISILYIHQDGKITGSAISLRNLLTGLDRELFTPRVLLASEGPARKLYEELNVPVDVIPIHAFWTFPGPQYLERGFIKNLYALLPNQELLRYLKSTQPNLVHINDKSMISAGLTAKTLNLPIVWHLRSTYNITAAKLNAFISSRLIKRCADYLIAISEDEIDRFENFSKHSIIFNTVDLTAADNALKLEDKTRKELQFQDDEIVVGLIGALDERKGAWDFIHASGIARKLQPNIKYRFVILAGIPNRNTTFSGLRGRLGLIDKTHPEDKAWQLARRAGIEDILTLTGFRNDPLNVIASFDIAVVFNRLGVLGRPPFEAMSVERPLIVSAGHSGRSTVVKPSETALVVQPSNVVELANTISQLSQSHELRDLLARNSRTYVEENFDPQKNTKRIQDIYLQVLNCRKTITVGADDV
jgi:glycosyltransferase involved in cell wall biosynthesis